MRLSNLFVLFILFATQLSYAQKPPSVSTSVTSHNPISIKPLPFSFQPGFIKDEYLDLMLVSARAVTDSQYFQQYPLPQFFTRIYQSNAMGLDNSWNLWVSQNAESAVINLRGTTSDSKSWLENFYAAMVPAKGALTLNHQTKFSYHLADHPQAGVHAGWLLGMAFLYQDIKPKMDSLMRSGTKNFYIVGHSQGGGIAFLLTSFLRKLQKADSLPSNIQFKTYCSAAPKPGNLFFAYEFEQLTQEGWAFNVVNPYDWVPESPLSIQTVDDMNAINPFTRAPSFIRKEKAPKRWVLKRIYNKLVKPSKKAQRNYEKYLGKMAEKQVKKYIPEFIPQKYLSTSHYVRTGHSIVLVPDSLYSQQFSDSFFIFTHHTHASYIYLSKKLNIGLGTPNPLLQGEWQLSFISGVNGELDSLYKQRLPSIQFDIFKREITGNSSCNLFGLPLQAGISEISFLANMYMTRMHCQGMGEWYFLEKLRMVSHYSVSENELVFLLNGIPLLKFKKII